MMIRYRRFASVLAGVALLTGLLAFRHPARHWVERVSADLNIGGVAVAREAVSPSGKSVYRVQGGATPQLIAAVRSAREGDVISLAPGIYSGVALKDVEFHGPVTITSADPADPAVLFDLSVRGSRNLVFSHLVLHAQDGGTINDFTVQNSSSISFNHLEIKGPPVRPDLRESGLMIRDSRNVSVTNCEFHDLFNGVGLLDNSDITIANNTLHDLRTDGVHGGGNSNVVVAGNLFANFYPAPGDHPDAIQFWTANTTASAENIAITGNVFVRGKGAVTQGIFFRDTVGNLPFKNVTIDGNLIVGAMYNGIATSGIVSGRVTNNTVVGLADFPKSWILIALPGGVVLQGNSATHFIVGTDGRSVPSGNRKLVPAADGGAKILSDWLATHGRPGGDRPIASQLLAALGYRVAAASPCGSDGAGRECDAIGRWSDFATGAAMAHARYGFGRAGRG